QDVVFVDVSLSDAARRSLEALIAALRTLPWMPWSPFDAERLHPHMTIAERCRPRFAELWDYLKPFERRYTAWLDNVTILRKTGERDGMDLWTVHRSFELGPGEVPYAGLPARLPENWTESRWTQEISALTHDLFRPGRSCVSAGKTYRPRRCRLAPASRLLRKSAELPHAG